MFFLLILTARALDHGITQVVISPATCSLKSPFTNKTHFYSVHCPNDEYSATITFQSNQKVTWIMDSLYKPVDPYYGISVDLSVDNSGKLVQVYVCPSETYTTKCESFRFDVYRLGTNDALLGDLALESSGSAATGQQLTPAFDPYVFNYTVSIPAEGHFVIAATAQSRHSTVGIEYPNKFNVQHQNGCYLAEHRKAMWKFPVPTKTNKPELFVICAITPDKKTFHTYYLQVNTITVLNARLKLIDVGRFKLDPPFDPSISTYRAHVPLSQKTIGVSAVSDDPDAMISMGNAHTVVSNPGQNKYTLEMPHNDMGSGQPPIWTRQLPIRVKKTDPTDPKHFIVMDYTITVHRQVSTFSFLKNLTVGETPCTLDPPFDPRHYEYQCVFPWEKSEFVHLVPIIDFPDCADCVMRVPDPKAVIAGYSHLNVEFREEETVFWRDKREWQKNFYFGEYHVVPIMIISQDQYTSHTYNVYVERAAPWWMRTSTTRFISTSATFLAAIMSVASVTNAMALVKQMQFMTLTADIQGCPPVYRDYANNLNTINLNFGWMMPDWLSGWSPAAIKKYKEHLIHKMELDQHYCSTLKKAGKDAALAFAKRHPHIFFTTDLMGGGMESILNTNLTGLEIPKVLSPAFLSTIGRRLAPRPINEPYMKEVDCTGSSEAAMENIKSTIHNLEQLASLFHGILGNLIFMGLFLIMGMLIYWSYYWFIFQWRQTRLRSLEAGPLWLFALDYCLIMFASCSSRLMFRPAKGLSIFGFAPSPTLISMICALGLISYPVMFLVFVIFAVNYMRRETKTKRPQLVWNPKMSLYTDPECLGINVTVPPPFPSFIPIFYQIFTQHIRTCIPIKDEDGKHFYVLREDLEKEAQEEQGKKARVANIPLALAEDMRSLLADTDDSIIDFKEEDAKMRERRSTFLKKREEIRSQQRSKLHILDENLDAQTAKEGAGLGEEWVCQIFGEKPVNWNWIARLSEEEINERLKTEKVLESLAEMKNSWVSKKERRDNVNENLDDYDKLEEEEIFALQQHIDQFIRKERRLHKYNILKPWPIEGYIQPLLPADEFASFQNGKPYIENELKERLMYPGDQPVQFPNITPHGESGATLEWMPEPKGGWEQWEKSQATKEGDEKFYADKWQYICFDYPIKPWYLDEASDVKQWWTSLIPRYASLQMWWRNRFAGRVPRKVEEDEMTEIKKWIWVELQPALLMKMRLSYFADQHPKYFRARSLEEIAKQDFHDAWLEIEHPRLRKGEGEDDSGMMVEISESVSGFSKRPRSKKDIEAEKQREIEREADPKADKELLHWTLMKYEDLHLDEPWWQGCDEEAPGETKIMMDNEMFWKSNLDTDLLAKNPHIPRDGFWSSTVFTQYPNVQFGCKRYNLLKPDGNRCTVEVKIKLKHTLPLMRYVPRFKVNVPSDILDMPVRNACRIVIGDRGIGHEYDYVVDRVATLMSILVLAAHAAGTVQAITFFISKMGVLINQMNTDYQSLALEKENTKKEGKDPPKSDDSMMQERLIGSEGAPKEIPFFSNEVFQKFLAGDVFVWFMQCLTLLLLCFGFTHTIPAPLTALLCILVTSGTMIFMNARSFKSEMARMVQEGEEKIQKLKAQVFAQWYKATDLFNRLIGRKVEISSEFYSAATIDLIVPEIGTVFLGEPEVDPSLPPEEQREAGLKKELICYSAKEDLKMPYRSVRMTDRFELDIKTGMTFTMDLDQLCLKKKMPQVAATIQCVNHAGDSNMCSPQYDSFLTLTKPISWEPEDNHNCDKINDLLNTWREQVQNWLCKDLGGMRTSLTGTDDIIKQIDIALQSACESKTRARRMLQVKVISIQGVPYQTAEYGNQDFYAMLLKETEDPIKSFPKERRTNTVTGSFEDAHHKLEGCTWPDEELDLELGAGDLTVRFSVWDEDSFSSDFVGLTQLVPVENLTSEYGPPVSIPLYRKKQDSTELIRTACIGVEAEKSKSLPLFTAGDVSCLGEDDGYVTASLTVQVRMYSEEEVADDIKRREWALEFANHDIITRENVKALEKVKQHDLMKALDIRVPRVHVEKTDKKVKKQGARKTTVDKEVITNQAGWDNDVDSIAKVITALEKLKKHGDEKRVIHYVFMSDHLKPRSIWIPDAITPHVAQLVVKELEVVYLIMMQGCHGDSDRERMNGMYHREALQNSGRSAYKHVHEDLFFYYDGEDRWIVSPRLGAPLSREKDFFFVTDPMAQSPDQIDEPFNFWDGNMWQCKPHMYCYEYDPSVEWDGNKWIWDTSDKNKDNHRYKYDQSRASASWFYKTFFAPSRESPYVDSGKTKIDKVITFARIAARKTYELFSNGANAIKLKKIVIRDCLSSMTASGVSFRWKDMNIEHLAPFRRYLLANFGTYETAWTACIARSLKVPFSDAVRALCDIVENIGNSKYQDLHDLVSDMPTLVKIHLCPAGDDNVTVDSAKAFWVSDSCPPELARMKVYLRADTEYDTFENFWAKLSEAQELDKGAFYKGCELLLSNFNAACKDKDMARKLSDQLFAWFDVQDSNGISLQEIIPASGKYMEHVNKSLLEFKIPLEYLRVIELDHKTHRVTFRANSKFVNRPEWVSLRKALDPDWKVADIENEMVQFLCRDTFFDVWKSVVTRSGMQIKQAWVAHYDGQITQHPHLPDVCMRHGYGEQRWKNGQVYRGHWRNHLPDGEGQLWTSLEDATNPDAKPIYDGQWKGGRRNGEGILRYEESMFDSTNITNSFMGILFKSRRGGIQKVYKGQFRDDFFYGHGELYVENGTVTQITCAEDSKAEYMKLPQIDPSQILSYEGEFRSEFASSKAYVSELYQIEWDEVYPALEGMKDVKDPNCSRFFPKDSKGTVQLCGVPLQDFAIDLYSKKGGDVVHMTNATKLEYADATTYSGGMCQGLPDGEGKMTQRRAETKQTDNDETEYKLLHEYSGQWLMGMKDGEGTLVDHRSGLKYSGRWQEDRREGFGILQVPPSLVEDFGYKRYEGDWKNDLRHGHGTMLLKNCTEYEGGFKNNLRIGIGALREPEQSTKSNTVDCEYANKSHAMNDLMHLVGGEGKYVFVEQIWEPKKQDNAGEKKKTSWGFKSKKHSDDHAGDVDKGPGSGTALQKGVHGGMYIVSINDQRNFAQGPLTDLWAPYGDEEPLKITFATMKDAMYNGPWRDDACFTSDDMPAWMLLEDERLYFGRVTNSGVREGYGILYAPTKDEAPAGLICAWHLGSPFELPSEVDEATKHQYVVYEGEWKDNLPSGKGTQYAPLATYIGEFEDGMRHGKGNLKTLDGTFKYVTIEDGAVGNWSRDKMHGVANVERGGFYHLRVIYKNDVCEMPYSETGPPTTGFDEGKYLGPVVNTMVSRKRHKHLIDVRDPRTDVDFKQIASKQPFRKSMDIKYDRYERRKTTQDKAGYVHVINEPTDFLPHEVDVIVSGGTGHNAIMNGLYFRLSQEFGSVHYMHYAKDAAGIGRVRYLNRNEQGTQWIINDKSQALQPGTARVQASCESLDNIVGAWHVYHCGLNGQPKYKPYSGRLAKEETPIDKISVKVVDGFFLRATHNHYGIMSNSVFLRITAELFDRPVYEVENGGQFLYFTSWTQKSFAEELAENNVSRQTAGNASGVDFPKWREESVVEGDEPRQLHLQKGAWCISDQLGMLPMVDDRDKCFAYCEDSAVTPDAIEDGNDWKVYCDGSWNTMAKDELSVEVYDHHLAMNRAVADGSLALEDLQTSLVYEKSSSALTDMTHKTSPAGVLSTRSKGTRLQQPIETIIEENAQEEN